MHTHTHISITIITILYNITILCNIYITSRCCRHKMSAELSRSNSINACTLKNHSSGSVSRKMPSQVRWGSVQSVLPSLPARYQTLTNSTVKIVFFFNLSSLITGHYELLLDSFLSSLAINIFATIVPAPNSVSKCISQFILQHSSQLPLKYQHSDY